MKAERKRICCFCECLRFPQKTGLLFRGLTEVALNLNEVVIATGNEGKVLEFSSLLGGVFKKFLSLENFPSAISPEETGTTFEENSLIKARAAFETACAYANRAVIADDSGLEVFCLKGRPGVFSARYAGENSTDAQNIDKLMSELKDANDRRARFVCSLTMILANREKITATGVCEGFISESPKGERGFGYDPVFFVPSLGKTMAEITREEKNRISHRAKAAGALVARLRQSGLIRTEAGI